MDKKMSTIENITISELKELIASSDLNPEAIVNLTIQDDDIARKLLQKRKSYDAIQQLRGSGNGRLMDELIIYRRKERDV